MHNRIPIFDALIGFTFAAWERAVNTYVSSAEDLAV